MHLIDQNHLSVLPPVISPSSTSALSPQVLSPTKTDSGDEQTLSNSEANSPSKPPKIYTYSPLSPKDYEKLGRAAWSKMSCCSKFCSILYCESYEQIGKRSKPKYQNTDVNDSKREPPKIDNYASHFPVLIINSNFFNKKTTSQSTSLKENQPKVKCLKHFSFIEPVRESPDTKKQTKD